MLLDQAIQSFFYLPQLIRRATIQLLFPQWNINTSELRDSIRPYLNLTVRLYKHPFVCLKFDVLVFAMT